MAVDFLSDTEQMGLSLEYDEMLKEIVVKMKRHHGVPELYCIEIGLVESQLDGGQMLLNMNPDTCSVIAPLKRHDRVPVLYCIEVGLMEFQSDGGQMRLNMNSDMCSLIAPLVWVKLIRKNQGHPIHEFLACY